MHIWKAFFAVPAHRVMSTEDNTQHAVLACLLEATARKPGNVHPHASFNDLTYADFVRSAYLIAPSFAHTAESGVGQTVLDAVRITQQTLGRNTNLGIALLLAPLAAVAPGTTLRDGIGGVLSRLDQEDARFVYEAIRLANPGGLGHVENEDVADVPTVSLLEAMRLAAHRDAIAAQYATNFSLVLAGAKRLERGGLFPVHWEQAVVDLHLWLMAEFPDTLIARKCGLETARESSRRAQALLESGWPQTESSRHEFSNLDAWLRADGHRRNPGTTADLVAAALFAAFRDARLPPPPIPECAKPFAPHD